MAGEADTCQLSVSFTYHSSGPICVTLVKSMSFYSKRQKQVSSVKCLVKRGGKWITFNLSSLGTSLLKPASAAYNLPPFFENAKRLKV